MQQPVVPAVQQISGNNLPPLSESRLRHCRSLRGRGTHALSSRLQRPSKCWNAEKGGISPPAPFLTEAPGLMALLYVLQLFL